MKFILLIVIIATGAAHANQLQHFFSRFQPCFDESGTTVDLIRTFFRERKYDQADYPALKGFIHCSYLLIDAINEDGEYNSENLANEIVRKNPMLSSAEVDVLVERTSTCGNQSGETVDEKSFNIARCIVRATPNN